MTGSYHRRIYIGIVLLCVFYSVSVVNERFGPQSLHYAVIAFLPYFWMGALIAEYRICGRGDVMVNLLRRYSQVGWCAVLAFILVGAKLDEPALQLVARIACLALMFLASFVPDSSFHSMILARWLARVGAISYSLYLVHLQVLQVVTPPVVKLASEAGVVATVLICTVLGLAAVLLCSTVFYWLIERPLATLNRRPRRSNARAPLPS